MKILIIYSARCGSNSVANYFLKQNTNYVYYNQPFSNYKERDIKKVAYDVCINNDNVLIKSEISCIINMKLTKEKLVRDFDKIIFLSRKNKREQAISYIVAENYKTYLDRTKKIYFEDGIDEEKLKNFQNEFEYKEKIFEEYKNFGIKCFYYEDLFYGSFTELFNYLELKYIEKDYLDILDKKNKYKSDVLVSKKTKTYI